MAHHAVIVAYATCVALSCICAAVWGTGIELHNDRGGCSWLSFDYFSKTCIREALLHRLYFSIPFITRRITTNSADLNLPPCSFNPLTPSNNNLSPPQTKTPPSPASKMHSSILLMLLSLLTLSHSVPLPQTDDNPVDVVSNSVSPLSANSAGNSNSDTGLLDGSTISLSPRTDYNPVDVVSNSVSPLSANSAGNSNSNTGVLDGADIDIKRDAQSDPTDVVSNSLSPLSDNVAGNNNQNTGTLDGNTVDIAPEIAPTINV